MLLNVSSIWLTIWYNSGLHSKDERSFLRWSASFIITLNCCKAVLSVYGSIPVSLRKNIDNHFDTQPDVLEIECLVIKADIFLSIFALFYLICDNDKTKSIFPMKRIRAK